LLWVGATLDIEELKRAEQALRESEAKFRDYAETASDWFWEIGPDYKFTLLTENAFGSNAADRIGTACWDHALDLETEPEKWRLVWATLDSRKPFRDFVYRGLGGNGSPMYVRASGKPAFDANGSFRGYRGTGTDGVSVQTRLTKGLAPVQGDRVQLQQVVLNLILNAVEAMSSIEVGARELLISTEQSETGGVLVAVRDSGPGIDPQHLERVFEAFYRMFPPSFLDS
jgi:signal transduction histidine kinase